MCRLDRLKKQIIFLHVLWFCTLSSLIIPREKKKIQISFWFICLFFCLLPPSVEWVRLIQKKTFLLNSSPSFLPPRRKLVVLCDCYIFPMPWCLFIFRHCANVVVALANNLSLFFFRFCSSSTFAWVLRISRPVSLVRSIMRRLESKPKNPPLFPTVNWQIPKIGAVKVFVKSFNVIFFFFADEQEFKSSQFHLGLEAAAALRGVALQRGRVQRAAAAASAYPAAAAAAAAAAMARPQLTAASLQYVHLIPRCVRIGRRYKYILLVDSQGSVLR